MIVGAQGREVVSRHSHFLLSLYMENATDKFFYFVKLFVMNLRLFSKNLTFLQLFSYGSKECSICGLTTSYVEITFLFKTV